ncbi:MAG: radical SAM protein [archaeon]|nr:radical SAM protein [archaeon]
MKVLMIHAPVRESLPPSSVPLGLAYIGAVLMKAGHKVEVLDICANKYTREEVEERVKKDDFDIVLTGGMITVYKYVKWLSQIIRKHHPNKPIFIGGAMPTSAPKVTLEKTEANAIILGEAEYTTLELVEAVEKGKGFEGIDGIWFKKDGKIVKNRQRDLIKNLDELPLPAWELFPMEIYINNPNLDDLPPGTKSLGMSTARGCPFNCTFCYNVFGARTNRRRGVDSIIHEIKELRRRYDVRAIHFSDDLFISNKAFVKEFCRRLIDEKIGLIWGTSGRVNTVNLPTLKRMKEAGCIGILYGFESGSQKMLDKMNKQVTIEQMKHAINITREAGLKMYPNFMVGIPGESVETIKETVEFIKEMDLYVQSLFIANPFPGSQLYDYAKSKGLIKDEEKFIEGCSECLELNLNVTDMSDEDLCYWRDWAVREILSAYRKRHPIKALRMDFHKISESVKKFGFIGTAKKAVNRIKRRIK